MASQWLILSQEKVEDALSETYLLGYSRAQDGGEPDAERAEWCRNRVEMLSVHGAMATDSPFAEAVRMDEQSIARGQWIVRQFALPSDPPGHWARQKRVLEYARCAPNLVVMLADFSDLARVAAETAVGGDVVVSREGLRRLLSRIMRLPAFDEGTDVDRQVEVEIDHLERLTAEKGETGVGT